MPGRFRRFGRGAGPWIPLTVMAALAVASACQIQRASSITTPELGDATPTGMAIEAPNDSAQTLVPSVTPSPNSQGVGPASTDSGTVSPDRSDQAQTPTLVAPRTTPILPTSTPSVGAPRLTFENSPTIPALDPYDLARRFGMIGPGLEYVPFPRQRVGDLKTFWALDLNDDRAYRVEAMLGHATENADLYVEIGANLSDDFLVEAGQVFEERVFPLVISTFGSAQDRPFEPIAMLHLALTGTAGYYDPTDEYPPEIYPFSNQRRMFYLDTTYVDPASSAFIGLVAHELQHAVHESIDPDEEGWVNEGLSALANLLFDDGQMFLNAYLARHANQLNAWTAGAADYGSAGLLMYYLYLNYPDGDGGLSGLVARQEDGFDGIDAYLREEGYSVSWCQLLAEWGAANYLDTKASWDPYPDWQVRLSPARSLRDPGLVEERHAPQFAPYFVDLNLPHDDDYIVRFNGEGTNRLIPATVGEPVAVWWSGGDDAADATLTRGFDLRDSDGTQLTLRIWHEIEETWDFAYVVVSDDDGKSWVPIAGPSMVPESDDRIGPAFGPGYTGISGGGITGEWVDEKIDLSMYDGHQILVRVEYVTDGAVNLTGFALGGAFIPAIEYSWDPSTGPGAWEADGFFFGDGTVGQEFEVRLLLVRMDRTHEIVPIDLDDTQSGSVRLLFVGEEYAEAALMVIPMAPATRQLAGFDVAVERLLR
jgi:immune inhibitor A